MVVTLSLNWTHKHTYVLVRCHSWCSSGLCWRPCAKPRTSLWVWMLNFSNQHRCSLQKHTNTHLNEHICVLMIYLSVQETQTHTHTEELWLHSALQTILISIYKLIYKETITVPEQRDSTDTGQRSEEHFIPQRFLLHSSENLMELTFIVNKICFT